MSTFWKRLSLGMGGLLGLVLILLAVLYIVGSMRANQSVAVTPTLSTVDATPDRLTRGKHLTDILGCRDCHGNDLSGQVFADVPPFRVVASNLTAGSGGIGQTYTVADWDRAIRHGVNPEGRGLYVMPSVGYHHLNDDDAIALIAYLQSLSPVDNELPTTELRLPGRLLVALGEIDPQHEVNLNTERSSAVPPGPTAEYGAYLAALTCKTCHGPQLQGGPHPDPGGPPAPDLRAAANWSAEAFTRAMRTGVLPSGSVMDPKWMPWSAFRHMTDDELNAVRVYLQTLDSALPAATAAP